MSDKFLTLNNGNITEKEASNVSTGVSDAGKIPALDSNGKLDNSFMPVGVGVDTKILPAYENLAAGDFVNVFDDAGTVKARKADASTNKPADGFVLAAVTTGQNATVYKEGTNNQVTGLTGGSVHFLSATQPGKATTTVPSTAGHIVQKLGKAFSTTEIDFEPSDPITRV